MPQYLLASPWIPETADEREPHVKFSTPSPPITFLCSHRLLNGNATTRQTEGMIEGDRQNINRKQLFVYVMSVSPIMPSAGLVIAIPFSNL